MLNVLHISTWQNGGGGSGRSAYKVHTGLKRLGIGSRMLVGFKTSQDPDVALIGAPWIRLADRIIGRGLDLFGLQYLFYPSSFILPLHRWFREADVIQLYNTHGGYFSHTVLPILSRRRPVVWRLSDMWSLTGHCAYSYECERWKSGCGSCPYLLGHPELYWDTTALLWRVKDWIYTHSRLTIVAPSRWIAWLAEQSPLLGRFPIHIIPNGLDTEVFRPLPKHSARGVFGIDTRSRVVLFSASGVLQPRKGASFLKEALKRLWDERMKDVMLLVAGAEADKLELDTQFPVKRLGEIRDDPTMAAVYSAADLFVLPTLAENLPNGVIESMACGTPPISFDVGGVSDAVRHMESGYLAAYRNTEDLAKGIQLLLDDSDLRSRMSRRCREVAEQEYSLDLQTQRFLTLYCDVIGHHQSRGTAKR